jgi:hypothetical protein
MKAKVVKSFRDKYTNEIYKENSEITISEERFAEILTVGPFVEKVEEPKATKEAEKEEKPKRKGKK